MSAKKTGTDTSAAVPVLYSKRGLLFRMEFLVEFQAGEDAVEVAAGDIGVALVAVALQFEYQVA